MHLWLAVFLIAAMGLVLGLLGGGGSILTVPILVYVLGVEAHAAIVLSLILVGGTSLVGVLLHRTHSHVEWRHGLFFVAFAAPLNFLGALVSRHVSAVLLLVSFGLLMCLSGAAMLLKKNNRKDLPEERRIWPVVASGAVVGFLAGFLGVGGGFMIVPSLVLFLRTPMKSATGTSLLVIAANSAVGLLGHRGGVQVDWIVLLELLPPALLATYVGVRLTQKLSAHMLRETFGVFVIVLGVLMTVNNTVLLFKR